MSKKTKKMTLEELAFSRGFTRIAPDDPIYQSGWTISVNPLSETFEESAEINTDFRSPVLDLTNRSNDQDDDEPSDVKRNSKSDVT